MLFKELKSKIVSFFARFKILMMFKLCIFMDLFNGENIY